MKKETFLTIIALIALILMTSSCGVQAGGGLPTSDEVTQVQSEQLLTEASREIGLPAIVNFQEKKLMKSIYELRDQENVICHAYLFNEYTGSVGQYLGKCLGYGIPYSTQFSNPEKVYHKEYSSTSGASFGATFTKQAEPNGLFMPEGLSATWLLLIDEDGEPRPTYIEPAIIVSPVLLE